MSAIFDEHRAYLSDAVRLSRFKTAIESGIRWLDTEDAAGAAGAMAACIAAKHPKWDERPLAVVVLMTPLAGGPMNRALIESVYRG